MLAIELHKTYTASWTMVDCLLAGYSNQHIGVPDIDSIVNCPTLQQEDV